MKLEDAEIVAEAALQTYKDRLATRLQPLILRQFADMEPAFVAAVMKALCLMEVIPKEQIIYPEGTKFFQRIGSACYVLVEQKPQVRTLQFLTDGEKAFDLSKDRWTLAFPYVLFAQVYNYNEGTWVCGGTFVAYRNKPLRAFDDTVYEVNLPNVNEFKICNGKAFSARGKVNEQVEQYIGHFWQGIFTTDWSDGYKDSPASVGKVKEWEKLTAKDPLAVLKTGWKGGVSLTTFLGKTGLKSDDFHVAASSYTREVISGAAQEAVRQVTNECKGVDTEALDKVLLDQMTKYLTEREQS